MSRLIVVGTGISVGQLTAEAREWITLADKVLYCVTEPAAERLILGLNASSETLYSFYGEEKPRADTYNEMVDRTLKCLDEHALVVVAYYGHPGFFVYPSHKAIELARGQGHEAKMLPAVSSLDCMIADLGVDIVSGCQIFEATDLILRHRKIDVCSHLVVLQVSALGDIRYSFAGYDHRHLGSLREYLLGYYPPNFEVTGYYASLFSVSAARINKILLADLNVEVISSFSTLYVPPLRREAVHLKRIREYGLEGDLLGGKALVELNGSQLDEML